MAVRGRVRSIRIDVVDHPYLTLEPEVRVEVTLADSALAVLSPGEHVVLGCSGTNVNTGIPVLTDCVLHKYSK